MSARLTRRHVVQAGAGATAVYALHGMGPLAPVGVAATTDHLRRATYAGRVGDVLILAGEHELRLMEVSDLARARSEPALAGHDDAFALTLGGPGGIAGGTYQLQHPALGTFELFLTPVGDGRGGQRYEVVVDRTVGRAAAQAAAPQPLEASNSAPAGAVAADPPPITERSGADAEPVQRATLARRGGVLSADIRVARGRGVTAVQVTLVRRGTAHARGFRRLGRRVGVRVALRRIRKVTAGEYVLVVTTTDRRGRRVTSEHRVTVQ